MATAISAPSKLLDGKALAKLIKERLKSEVKQVCEALGMPPGLAVILVGDNPASKVYVKNKEAACAEVGIHSFPYNLAENITQTYLLELIGNLNRNPQVHAILVQLPLPKQIDPQAVAEAIDPSKDADGFHPMNLGKLMSGLPCPFIPPTPAAVMKLIEQTGQSLDGKQAVIVGRSNIVGKPLIHLLLQRHATVSICHSHTKNLASVVKTGDIVIAAAGKPRLIEKNMIKANATVIDVGINRDLDGKLIGDVNFEEVEPGAKFITPVPGGVGPMTIAMLLKNTVDAAKRKLPEFL